MSKPGAMLPARALFLWLALVVALLSSVMTAGLPRSTQFGSAFNPATVAVALKPDPRMVQRPLLELRGGGAGTWVHAMLAPMMAPDTPRVAPRHAAVHTPSYAIGAPTVPIAAVRASDASPREPPRA